MIKVVISLSKLLNTAEKKRMLTVLLGMIILSAAEATGVISIVPLLLIAGKGAGLLQEKIIGTIHHYGWETPQEVAAVLAVFAFATLGISTGVRAFVVYRMNRFIGDFRHAIGLRMMTNLLIQPYSNFLNKQAHDLIKKLLYEVDQVTDRVLKPLLLLLSNSIVCLAIIAVVFWLHAWLAFAIASCFVAFYIAIYLFFKPLLYTFAREKTRANEQRFKSGLDIIGGIKEVKVLGKETAFCELFDRASQGVAWPQAKSESIATIPPYLAEALAFALIIGFMLYLSWQQNSMAWLSTIGLFVFAGYRLLPALQKVYAAATSIHFHASALETTLQSISALNPMRTASNQPPLAYKKSLRFEHVSYTYPQAQRAVFENLSLDIKVGSKVAIIGPSGVGKSTLLDLLLGLLTPTQGHRLIDDTILTPDNYRCWLTLVGYVSQSVFFSDDSIVNNIAFGVAPADIDLQRVQTVAKIAQLHEEIMQCKSGYQTKIGDGGLRLSGGQRQRLALARALYPNPQVIILDEATNSLDTQTETACLQALFEAFQTATIIMVSHQDTALRWCQQYIRLQLAS